MCHLFLYLLYPCVFLMMKVIYLKKINLKYLFCEILNKCEKMLECELINTKNEHMGIIC